MSRELRTIGHALVLVAGVLAVIALALWLRGGPLEPQAAARGPTISPGMTGVPDSGQQRQRIIQELEKINSRLERLDEALRDGKYVVQTRPAPGAEAAKGNEK